MQIQNNWLQPLGFWQIASLVFVWQSLEPSYFLWLQSCFKHLLPCPSFPRALARIFNFKIVKISYFQWVFLVWMNINTLFYLRKMFQSVGYKSAISHCISSCTFFNGSGIWRTCFKCGTADCSSNNGLGCCFVFPSPQLSGNWGIWNLLLWGRKLCFELWLLLKPAKENWSLQRRIGGPLPPFLILQSKI